VTLAEDGEDALATPKSSSEILWYRQADRHEPGSATAGLDASPARQRELAANETRFRGGKKRAVQPDRVRL